MVIAMGNKHIQQLTGAGFRKYRHAVGKNKQKACSLCLLEWLFLQDYRGLLCMTQHTLNLARSTEWEEQNLAPLSPLVSSFSGKMFYWHIYPATFAQDVCFLLLKFISIFPLADRENLRKIHWILEFHSHSWCFFFFLTQILRVR